MEGKIGWHEVSYKVGSSLIVSGQCYARSMPLHSSDLFTSEQYDRYRSESPYTHMTTTVQTKTLETQAPENKAALSTPAELDLRQMIIMLSKRKMDEHGKEIISTKRGKQSLFSATCAWYKSLRGMSKETHVSIEVETEIREHINSILTDKFTKMLGEYETFTVMTGGLTAKVGKEGTITTEAIARINASRSTKNDLERKLAITLAIGQLDKQINKMLDNPSTMDREKLSGLQKKLEILQNEGRSLAAKIASEKK
jgi:hypothetical protein